MHTQIQLYSEADSATLKIPTGHTEQRTCHMPTHTTLGLVHTRTLRNPSDGRKQSNVCRYWNGTSPISAGRYCEPTHHKHQPQAYVQDGEQRATANHKVRCSTESTPRVPDAPENGVRDSAIQTKTNMDHLQQTTMENAETVTALSRGTPLTKTPSKCADQQHTRRQELKKTMAGIIHCSTSRTKLPQQKRTDCQCSPRTNISHPSLRALVLTSSRKSCCAACACAQLVKHAI